MKEVSRTAALLDRRLPPRPASPVASAIRGLPCSATGPRHACEQIPGFAGGRVSEIERPEVRLHDNSPWLVAHPRARCELRHARRLFSIFDRRDRRCGGNIAQGLMRLSHGACGVCLCARSSERSMSDLRRRALGDGLRDRNPVGRSEASGLSAVRFGRLPLPVVPSFTVAGLRVSPLDVTEIGCLGAVWSAFSAIIFR